MLSKLKTLSDDEKLAILKQKDAIVRLLREWEEGFIADIAALGAEYPGVKVVRKVKRAVFKANADEGLLKWIPENELFHKSMISVAQVRGKLAAKIKSSALADDVPVELTKKESEAQAREVLKSFTFTPQTGDYELVFVEGEKVC